MADELIDIVDKNNNLTGVQKNKSEAHKYGLLHRSAHVWVYNSKGEILIQLRAKNKLLFPNAWDITAAGHVGAGEKTIDAGIRELKEELGIEVKESDLDFLETHKEEIVYNDILNNEFYSIYITKLDIDPKNLTLQKEEVADVKFIELNELERDLKLNPKKYVQSTWYWNFIIKVIKKRINA